MWLLVILLLVTVVLLLGYIRIRNYEEKYKELKAIYPSPYKDIAPENRIVAHIFHFPLQPDKLFLEARKVNKENKGFGFGLPILGVLDVHICNAEDAEVVLNSTVNLQKSFIYDFLHDWLGTGLLTSTDQKWRNRRKMLTPAFHFSMLHHFVDIMLENTERLIKDLEPECDKDKTNIKRFISNFTLCTICETSMGTQLYSKSAEYTKYFEAVYKVGALIIYRFTRPWLYNSFIYKLFFGLKNHKYLKILHNFTESVIRNREKNFTDDVEVDNKQDVNLKKRFAMLDLLIKEKKKNKIDFEGVREEVDTFMFEGHDTVSMSLNYTLLILANHPEIQEKILAEIKDIYSSGKRRLNYHDLQNMNYLEMCIKESLRICPSVPIVGRKVAEEITLKGVKIPVNTGILVHIYDIHRDKRFFPDPEKFDPERFSPENVVGRNPFAYIPFSAGPRNCIGQKFAMLELKSVISEILWNYSIEPVQSLQDLVFTIDIVLRSQGPIYIKFKKRTRENLSSKDK